MAHRPRILWLHTQPEHYHNCMMDDLARSSEFDYVAGFCIQGAGSYKDYPVPRDVPSVFLTPRVADGSRPGFFGKFHRDWRRDLSAFPYDAAIVSGYGGRTQREVIFDCHRRGIPVAMYSDSNIRSQRGHTCQSRAKRLVKKKMLSRLLCATNLLLTANSRGIAYWRYYGALREQIVLCPYYSDYAKVEAARATSRDESLRLLGLAKGDRYLFTAARLVPAKGLDQMIRAFLAARLGERGWHYCIAGMGPLETELKALARAALGKSIHFLGFQQPAKNLALMAHADLFVLPSVYEPHGIVVAESVAAGTPVLASNVCGAAADLVVPGKSGDFFITGNVEDLQIKLTNLISDPVRLLAMRGTARETFNAWFAATSPIKVVPQAIARLLQHRKGTAVAHSP